MSRRDQLLGVDVVPLLELAPSIADQVGQRVVGGQPVALVGAGQGVVAHRGVELVGEAGGVFAEGLNLEILVDGVECQEPS